jgi:uncharacterized membrane protein (DUF485 family)
MAAWEGDKPMNDQDVTVLRNDPDFRELVRARGRLGWTLTAAMLVIYFTFIVLVAWAPGFVGLPVFGIMTLGFPLGLGVILSAIALTGYYVLQANRRFDSLTRRIKERAL